MSTTRLMYRYARGFSLIELVIAIVIVSVGVVGLLSVLNTYVRQGADPMVRKQAMALADSILEEILLKPFADPDGLGGETTRATFDDVSDYHGKTQTTFTDLPVSLSGYSVQISVTATALGTVTAKRVQVTVSRGGESITMTGYRTQDPT